MQGHVKHTEYLQTLVFYSLLQRLSRCQPFVHVAHTVMQRFRRLSTRLGGGSTQLWVTRHVPPKKTQHFFRSLSPKDPHFYQLSPNDPLFLANSLSPKDPDTSLSLKDSSFSHLIVKQVTILSNKKKKKIDFFDNFNEMLRFFLAILALETYIFWCISLKDPLFLCALSLKDPPFWRNLSPKDPTSEVLGGSRTSFSYVSDPRAFNMYLTMKCKCTSLVQIY